MIKQLTPADFPVAVDVIVTGFATVAVDFGLTIENCPRHTAFSTNVERLQTNYDCGWLMFGLFDRDKMVGYVSLSKEGDNGVYELHNLAVMPEYRHCGYGRRIIDHCKKTVQNAGGNKIILSHIEENKKLKNWYVNNGFVHTGTKKFDHLPFTSGYMECPL